MFTQPPAEQEVTTFDEATGKSVTAWVPVLESLWTYFATSAQADQILAKAQNLVAGAVLIDGLGTDIFIPVRYLTGDQNPSNVKMWVLKGTFREINGTIDGIDEWAGNLYDRSIKPNPFVDNHGGTLGGPDLIATPITVDGVSTGLAQLSWGHK